MKSKNSQSKNLLGITADSQLSFRNASTIHVVKHKVSALSLAAQIARKVFVIHKKNISTFDRQTFRVGQYCFHSSVLLRR